jgi:hypothetical protein
MRSKWITILTLAVVASFVHACSATAPPDERAGTTVAQAIQIHGGR